jgi:hypothetical protein
MPHYFFDTFDGEAWVIDEEGFECAHPDAALAQAQAGLGDIAEDELPDHQRRAMIVRVRDGHGPVLEAHLDLDTVWLR